MFELSLLPPLILSSDAYYVVLSFAAGAKAQQVKRWPTNLGSQVPARGETFSTANGVPLHIAFHYHPPIVLI